MAGDAGAATRIGGLKDRLVSTLLVSLTLVIAALCVIVLSSTLTQSRLSAIAIDGVSLSIWKLDSIGRQWAGIRGQIRDLSDQATIAQRDNSAKVALSTIAAATYGAKKADFDQSLQQFYHRIASVDTDLANAIRNKGYADQIGEIAAAQARLHASHPELDDDIKFIQAAYADLNKAERERDVALVAQEAVVRQIADLTTAIKDANDQLDNLFNLIKPSLDQGSRARVDNALYELYFGTTFTSTVLKRIVTAPTDILTLSLVVLMGVLGSALQMTYAYVVKNQPLSLGSYLLRLSVGAITALVIFIVAKAGVPVIADASQLGGNAAINPYFASFLAIISGLLSENAIASVQAQGAKFFGTGTDGPDRWTRDDLNDEVKTQNLSLPDLAAYLGETEDMAAAQLKGEEKIAAPQQKVIAIYLRKDPRKIYTDIPPPAKA